ncbi:FAD-dependent oxidoreductase [Salipaludibacillus keqinensis]|uniref:FAD-dependent oxidoreductase n=1 Tax=Salipaludibacillus keqinensis TaxID=2045207 RepID=A0A323TYI4_9BACI|nr:FAD-dependent oxidoreductase [Salipaludibacillus keqinensis]PYZ94615.1 FAD-dependent oxidoreductase [Salipaludibacillus keqinensis]
MTEKVVVVGSGFAGLTAGALLQKEGYEVTLLEAAAEWGGCAGKFRRKNFTFPVGATLGMGFEENGLHRKINDSLSIHSDVLPLETVMDVRIGDRVFPYFTERSRFLSMWEKEEPVDALRIMNFFNEVWRIGQSLRKHMLHYPVLPPKSIQELQALLRGFSPMSVTLIPYLGRTLGFLVKKHRLEECHSFIHFINGVLMDSMQTTADKCELMMGATALDIYHHGAFYVRGGLFRVAEDLVSSIKENGGIAKKPREVVSIQKKDHWVISDHRGNEYKADHVVMNVPLSNIKTLLDEKTYREIQPSLKKKEDPTKQWGTFTTYLAIKDEAVPREMNLFHQVMVNPKLEPSGANHFFMSLSEKGDHLRASAGFRTMTVSTHINLNEWQTQEQYEQQSKVILNSVTSKLKQLMPGIDDDHFMYEITGGPRAWERFVKRQGGGVGGFPQTKENALWNAVQHRTKVDGLWLCGDNIFPGAGSIGATSSGVHVARSISGKKLV